MPGIFLNYVPLSAFLKNPPDEEFMRNLLVAGHFLNETQSPEKQYALCVQFLSLVPLWKKKHQLSSEFAEDIKEELLELSSKQLEKSVGCIPMFYLLLTVFSFDQDILSLNSKFKPYISQIPNRKCADICRVYYSFVKFKGQRKKPRKLMGSINLCNLVIKRVGQSYQDDQDRWESH